MKNLHLCHSADRKKRENMNNVNSKGYVVIAHKKALVCETGGD